MSAQTQTETQTPTPGGMTPEMVEVVHDTWGSHSTLDLVILNDLQKFYAYQVKCHADEVYYMGIRMLCRDRSSRKNAHKTIYIPKDVVKAVIRFVDGDPRVHYGNGRIVLETDYVIRRDQRYEYKIRVDRWVYVSDDLAMVVKQEDYVVEKKFIAKPKVIVKKENGSIVIIGDTYHIKEAIKQYGFKWDSIKRAWVASTFNRLDELKRELEKAGAEVVIE